MRSLAKPTLKTLRSSWLFVCFLKSFRSFNTVSFEFVDKRALKLLVVKVGGLAKKKASCSPILKLGAPGCTRQEKVLSMDNLFKKFISNLDIRKALLGKFGCNENI